MSLEPSSRGKMDTADDHASLVARLQARAALKAKYHRLQNKYARALEARKDLTIEVSEKEAKVQRLQDEVDLIIEQIHDSDYAHLAPEAADYFSADEADELEDTAAIDNTAKGDMPQEDATNEAPHNHHDSIQASNVEPGESMQTDEQ